MVLEHSLNWVKGEIFEALMLALWGGLLMAMAALFYFLAQAPAIRSMFLPFLIVGALWGAAGASSYYVNNARVSTYTEMHAQDPAEFLVRERARVDRFIWAYKYLLAAWSLAIAAGLCAFMFWGGSIGREIGIGLILLGLGGLLVDHTSELNAHNYDALLNASIQTAKPAPI